MHSHVLPMPPCTWIAVSHTVRAARAQYALATRPAASASAGASVVDGPRRRAASTLQRALHERTSASASRCCTAWNEPIGTPYCRRSAAYVDGEVEHAAHHADEVGAR